MSKPMSGHTVEYCDANGLPMKGYLFLPQDILEPVAGVAVVPEAPGSGPMPIKRAQMLAEAGFAAFVVDLYGEGLFTGYTPEANDRAQAMLAAPQLLLERVEAGVNALFERPEVDAKRVAAMGYCLGGKGVLDLARAGASVVAAVSFHGLLTPFRRGPGADIKAKILVLTGAKDPLVPLSDTTSFCEEMLNANTDFRIAMYGKAGHAFTSFEVPRGSMPPELGEFGHDEQADQHSWGEAVSFLSNCLSKADA